MKNGIALKLNKFSLSEGMLQRIIAVTVANIIMALAVSMLRMSLFGNDPFSCMNLGFGIVSGFSYGSAVLIFNFVMIVPIFLIARDFIRIGTLVNMFVIGPVADIWFGILQYFFGTETLPLETRVVFLILGVIINCWGCSLYFCSELGLGPYDCIGWIIERRTNKRIPFRFARIILDSTAVTIGFLCGSIVGLGTVILACCTGPLITFFSDHVNRPLLAGAMNK